MNAASALDTQPYPLTLRYGEQRIVCEVRMQAARRQPSIAIHVDIDGRVLVDAPMSAPRERVRQALMRRVAWIARQREAVAGYSQPAAPREYVSGETWHYLGRRYLLKVVRGSEAVAVRLRGGYLEINVEADAPAARVRDRLEAWYRQRAHEVLTKRMAAVSADLRWVRVPPPITLRRMRRQWGSCSPAGRITLNTELIRAPRACIDYVILHELCHLKAHDHSKGFYRLLDAHAPDWRRTKTRLDGMAAWLLAR